MIDEKFIKKQRETLIPVFKSLDGFLFIGLKYNDNTKMHDFLQWVKIDDNKTVNQKMLYTMLYKMLEDITTQITEKDRLDFLDLLEKMLMTIIKHLKTERFKKE